MAIALESRPERCRRWHQPSHYIRKGRVSSPPCPGPPGWPQLFAGRGLGQQAPGEGEASCDSSGEESWDTPGWEYSCCVDGVRRRSQQSTGLAVLWLCSWRRDTYTEKY